MNERKLLLAQCYQTTSLYDSMFGDTKKLKEYLQLRYPASEFSSVQRWLATNAFDRVPTWPDRYSIRLYKTGSNIPGHFIAANLRVPTTVIDEPATPELLMEYLDKESYTHVGLGIYVDGYTDFVKCARAIKKHYPDIITIAGNVGAMFPGTEKYVDHVCRGDGVAFLRELFGEDVNSPRRISATLGHMVTDVFGITFKSEMLQIVTKIGCPQKCDFCVTNKLFSGAYSGPYFTPQQVHDEIIAHARKTHNKIKIGFAEPTAIVSLDWWYELFRLFEQDDGDFAVIIASTAASMNALDLDRVKKSSLRIDTVNLGVESFDRIYVKNRSLDMKSLIHHLADYGISTYATYIIGFDHHTRESVWQDVKKLVDLDAAAYGVINLKPLPETPIWEQYKAAGRLLDVPWDFYYMLGFQPYTHPHFKPGFEDMLPLLVDVNAYIERERGMQGLDIAKTLENIQDKHLAIKKQVQIYKILGRVLFKSWVRHLHPTAAQIASYKLKASEPGKHLPSIGEIILGNNFTRKMYGALASK
ncbi:MAG: radical SAM protein [Candidatus Sigynarchaeota archaeon]